MEVPLKYRNVICMTKLKNGCLINWYQILQCQIVKTRMEKARGSGLSGAFQLKLDCLLVIKVILRERIYL